MTINTKATEFFKGLCGKHVAVCGLGNNNIPVVHQLLSHGARVTACDRRDRQQLGKTAQELEQAGAKLSLGETYLDALNQEDIKLILRTPGMKPYLPEFESAKKRGVLVTSEMELFFSLCPAPITAVTGSDGKTTTTSIIAGLLKAAGKHVHLGGNIGNALLPVIYDVLPHHEVVAELSSFQLTGMTQSPSTAVITNIAPNHLDWHTDMNEYIEAKKNLVAWQSNCDISVLNADNKYTKEFANSVKSNTFMFSRVNKVDCGAWLSNDGMLTMTQNGIDTPVVNSQDIRIKGLHNIENYLAAIAAVWGKVSTEVIADFARAFEGVSHRCELVRVINGVYWYNDSIGTSPSRTIAGLKSFDTKVILIAGGYDKRIPFTPLGEVAESTVKRAILMGDTADSIESVLKSDIPIDRVEDMEQAVKTAYKIAKPNDIVFMSPASASFGMYTNFEQRGNHFKQLVNSL